MGLLRSGKLLSIVACALGIVMTLFASCSSDRISELEGRVEERISTVLALHSAEYVYRDVIYFGEQNQFLGFIPAGNREILFSVSIVVRAGVDLRQGFSVEATERNTVIITLPQSRILYSDVDEQTINQYFVNQIGREISFIEVQDVISEAKDDLVADAISRGILNQADQQAEEIVEKLMEDLGVSVELRRTPASNSGNGTG